MAISHFLCTCGRSFDYQNALSNHTRRCKKKRGDLAETLDKARKIWQARKNTSRKRSRIADEAERYLSQEPQAPALATWTRTDEVSRLPVVIYPVQWLDERQADGESSSGPVESSPGPMESSSVAEDDLELPIARRREKRKTIHPGKFRDFVPSALLSFKQATSRRSSKNAIDSASSQGRHVERSQPSSSGQQTTTLFYTTKNRCGLLRCYLAKPFHDPDGELKATDFVDVPETTTNLATSVSTPSSSQSTLTLGPYPNESSFLLGEWFWANKSKTLEDFRGLIDIITSRTFSIDDIRNTPWNQINQALGSSNTAESRLAPGSNKSFLFDDAGWRTEEVVINVPFNSAAINPGPQKYVVGEFYCRSIIAILRERLSGESSKYFHYEPFQLLWEPDDNQPSQRVYGELYSSQAFIDEHKKLHELPPEPNCNLPRVVAALMFASDETHLTQFGHTTVHPLYLYFGNFSKYLRAKTSRRLCNHVAYFIKLPRNFVDYYRSENGGRPPSESTATHCSKEAFHAQWKSILDDEFMSAYTHGVVIKCAFDGQERRFYPRVFTLSADYKEKVALCGIRQMGTYPCPRCLIPISMIENMGTPEDREWRTKNARVDDENYRAKIQRAQDFIYKENCAVDSKNVEGQLFPQSLVASQNAFSQRLSPHGFNIFGAMVVDCLHEVEGGTWESLYTHLLRILECVGGHLTDELDSRYRETPTFGCETIRRFRRNSSQLGYMAMREWEDLLQCAIPAFEGLLPEPHNSQVLDLLYVLASWHGFAKLREHTETTLKLLDQLTEDFGALLRSFTLKTCAKNNTRELAREVAARNRRRRAQAKRRAENATSSSREKFPPPQRSATQISHPSLNNNQASTRHIGANVSKTDLDEDQENSTEPQAVEFSLSTYKFHAMGDYVDNIRRFGTVDSYSTESGELEHRTPKSYYSRTSKKNVIQQMTSIERRQARIRRIREALGTDDNTTQHAAGPASLEERYNIGRSENNSFHISHFIRQHSGDPAIKSFYSDLREHILERLQDQAASNASPESNETISDASFFIQRDRLYSHKTMRLNYTTYDVRRAQDLINPNTCQCNIMVFMQPPEQQGISSSNPTFAYARVLGIYHVNIILSSGDPKPRRFDLLWVRWYQQEEVTPNLRLPKLLLPPIRLQSCAFIDPSAVVRASHIIPAFAYGRRYSGNCRAMSALGKEQEDWKAYYISQFADRDLLLRVGYWGLGIGHVHERNQRRAFSQYARIRPRKEGGLGCPTEGTPGPAYRGDVDPFDPYEGDSLQSDTHIAASGYDSDGSDEQLDDDQFAQRYYLYEG